MREMLKMVIVLTVLSSFSGGLLAAIRNNTQERIENQQLQFVKGPAISAILHAASNDPIADRFTLKVGEVEKSFFVGVVDGKPSAIAFETSATGFGGPVGLMVGVDLDSDALIGVGVTTHSETPGLGSRAKDDPKFSGQFKGMSILKPIQVTSDGGAINAISGATITSRAVCLAASDAGKIYQEVKDQLLENSKAFQK